LSQATGYGGEEQNWRTAIVSQLPPVQRALRKKAAYSPEALRDHLVAETARRKDVVAKAGIPAAYALVFDVGLGV
jgi:hypothetical protein